MVTKVKALKALGGAVAIFLILFLVYKMGYNKADTAWQLKIETAPRETTMVEIRDTIVIEDVKWRKVAVPNPLTGELQTKIDSLLEANKTRENLERTLVVLATPFSILTRETRIGRSTAGDTLTIRFAQAIEALPIEKIISASLEFEPIAFKKRQMFERSKIIKPYPFHKKVIVFLAGATAGALVIKALDK